MLFSRGPGSGESLDDVGFSGPMLAGTWRF
jgi:hypothetical protein